MTNLPLTPPAAPTPANPLAENSPSPSDSLVRGFFFVFLACFAVFLPFGILITETAPNDEPKIDTLPPISTGETPPKVTPPQNPGTPRTNQPTPVDPRMVPPSAPPAAAMPIPENSGVAMPENAFAAQTSNIREFLSGFANFVRRCRTAGGTVQSGIGGAPLCSNDPTLFWPTLTFCGPSSTDTVFTVLRGDQDNWDLTVTCRDFPACDGPGNALCTAQGCVFGGTCVVR